MKVSEIAKKLDLSFCGDDVDINSVRFSYCANKNDIAIIYNDNDIKTKALCILSNPMVYKTDKTIIYTLDNVELAAVKIANILIKELDKNNKITFDKNENYYIGQNVKIGKNTKISPNVYIESDVVIGTNCYISPNVHIKSGTKIGNNVKIGSFSTIGSDSFCHYSENNKLNDFIGNGTVLIKDDVTIGTNTTIERGSFSDTIIGENCKIGNFVDIGHDVYVGKNCKIVSQTGIASNVYIGNFVMVYGQVCIANGVVIEDNVAIYAKSLVTKSVKANQKVSGIFAKNHYDNLKIQAKLRKL